MTSFAAHFSHRTTLGGTNVRAALAMSQLGLCSSLRLVSVDDSFRRLLPPGTDYICSAPQDWTWPHLIVQFPAGAQVRVNGTRLRAPHSNRLIYVNDPPNRQMALSPDLGHLLKNVKVFLVSGFNSMQDITALDACLADLRHHGDSFTHADHDEVTASGRHPGGLAVARSLPQLLPGQVCCVPAFSPATATPTIVGLGDAFVGGFLAGLQPT